MKPANADDILAIENVDGLLVGGASLDPSQFLDICEKAHAITTETTIGSLRTDIVSALMANADTTSIKV